MFAGGYLSLELNIGIPLPQIQAAARAARRQSFRCDKSWGISGF